MCDPHVKVCDWRNPKIRNIHVPYAIRLSHDKRYPCMDGYHTLTSGPDIPPHLKIAGAPVHSDGRVLGQGVVGKVHQGITKGGPAPLQGGAQTSTHRRGACAGVRRRGVRRGACGAGRAARTWARGAKRSRAATWETFLRLGPIVRRPCVADFLCRSAATV